MSAFPHLHVVSAFSAHHGVSWPADLAAAAAPYAWDRVLLEYERHLADCAR